MKKLILSTNLIVGILALSACNATSLYENSFYSLDTLITIKLYNVKDADTHFKNIKKLYNNIDDIADDFQGGIYNKSVYDLNNEREIEANDLLVDLVSKSIELCNDTDGYYNPLIGRLSHIWKNSISSEVLPTNDVIESELNIMNTSNITITGNTIKINGDANLDLGGIAKGYATKLAYQYLEENNITNYLIIGGGSSVTLGTKEGKEFSAALEKPNGDGYIGIIKAMNINIATSSPKYQHKEIDGNLYHHLLSPFTGKPINIYDSVNIMCSDPLLADCYSTALFAMDYDKALSFASSKNIDILLYKDDSILYKTEGWCFT